MEDFSINNKWEVEHEAAEDSNRDGNDRPCLW